MIDDLCVIERVFDISGDKAGAPGVMSLSIERGDFCLCWIPSSSDVGCVFETVGMTDAWEHKMAFKVHLSTLSMMTFKEEPLSFSLHRNDKQKSRTFALEDQCMYVLASLVEQLVLNGVVVVSDKGQYCLEFHRLVGKSFLKPSLELQSRNYESFEAFWACVIAMAESVFLYLDDMRLLTKSVVAPILIAAKASHAAIMDKIALFFEEFAEYQQVGALRWNKSFDGEGRVKQCHLRENLYYSGIDESLLPEAIPFVVGLFSMSSTSAERTQLLEKLKSELEIYEKQLLLISEKQIERNKQMMLSFRVINHDIARTEKSLAAFRDPESLGNVMSAKILKLYCLYNPGVSYCQGMNDLLQPILATFLGGGASDDMLIVKAFWCFDSLLRNTNRLDMISNVNAQCKKQAGDILRILREVSPAIAGWLRVSGLSKLMWMHSDFVLLFKRTFRNVWDVWVQFNCSPDPANWLSYFTAALLLVSFTHLSQMPETSMSILMDAFPRYLQTLDTRAIARTAVWIFNTVAPIQTEQPPQPIPSNSAEQFSISFHP